MADTKLVTPVFIILLSIGLANAARVARYSQSAEGGGEGGGNVTEVGSGSRNGAAFGENNRIWRRVRICRRRSQGLKVCTGL
jgi:hypothetical protein